MATWTVGAVAWSVGQVGTRWVVMGPHRVFGSLKVAAGTYLALEVPRLELADGVGYAQCDLVVREDQLYQTPLAARMEATRLNGDDQDPERRQRVAAYIRRVPGVRQGSSSGVLPMTEDELKEETLARR